MKIKKTLALLLAATTLCACSSTTAPSSTTPGVNGMTPGTYTSKQTGYASDFDVTVTVDETSITDIIIGDNSETQSIGGKAIEQLPQLIMDQQSISVDGISGATYTSNAIINGVKDCLTQANADLALFEKTSETVSEGETIEMNKQVVIVGAGAAGLTTAIRLQQQGITDIVVLEQMAYTGGASATCGGGFIAGGANDQELTEVHAQNSGLVVDWLKADVGVSLNDPAEGSLDFTAEGGGAGFMETLVTYANDQGIEILTDTKANSLIHDGQGVHGVNATNSNGDEYVIHSDIVVLATGGYGANQEMTEQANIGRVIYYGPVSSDGSGLTMATEIGATTRNMEYVGVKPNGLEVTSGVGKYTQPANNAMWKASAGFSVNKQGERVVNEQASEEALVNAYKQQEDWALYTVMDQNAYDVFYSTAIEKHLFSESDAQKWIDEKGTGTTIFVCGDTVDDAAMQAGIDADTLQATIDSFNEGIENGTDEFGRDVTMTFDDTGKIYIVKQNLRFATTLGGLDVTMNMEVQKDDGSTINGLYAAGEVIGAEQGDASTGYLSWASTSGYLAANAIVDALQ